MRMFATVGIPCVLVAAGLAACSSGPGGTNVIVLPGGWASPDSGSTPGSIPGTDGGSTTTDGGMKSTPPPGDGGAATGVPCDVATMLGSLCTGCHSDPPVAGSLAGLVTYADLLATSHEDATKNEAQLSLVRMQSTTSPMPPGSPPPASDVTTLQTWISAGYPKGSCGSSTSDAGEGGATTSMGVFTGAPAFSSMTGPHTHNAGQDCLKCHGPGSGGDDAPLFSFAGTLYDGSGNPVVGAEVRLVDSTGTGTSVYTSDTGTFYSKGSGFSAPAHVGARDATSMQNMLTALESTAMGPAVTGGACSACHCTGGSCTTAEVHLP